jgi:thiamine-phosphate pyrophosphorylase
VVTDRQQTAGRSLEEVIASAARGGAGMVQLREKDLSARELLALGDRLQHILAPYGIPLLINDRLDVAQALEAAGVHLAGHSLPAAQARRVLGSDKLIGVSTHSLEQAQDARDGDADFIVFGPVFTTPSKAAYGPPQGLQQLANIVQTVDLPVIAIGGINMTNLPSVLQHGAHGVAMIRAVIEAAEPDVATRQLRDLLPM